MAAVCLPLVGRPLDRYHEASCLIANSPSLTVDLLQVCFTGSFHNVSLVYPELIFNPVLVLY